MKKKKEYSSTNNNLKISFYKYKGKLFEVWWRKPEEGSWEFSYSPGKIMLPKEHIKIHEVSGRFLMLDVMIKHGLYEECVK